MKITKSQLKRIIKEELLEARDPDGVADQFTSAWAGFGPPGTLEMEKKNHPSEYKEADEKGLLPTYEKVSKKYTAENPHHHLPLPSFLKNLDRVKEKYPEFFSETSPAPSAGSKKSYSTKKAAESIAKMNTALRNMEPTFRRSQDLRQKYDKATEAVSALHFAIQNRQT